MKQYINLVPRWSEILGVWLRILNINSDTKDENDPYFEAVKEFCRMARGADNYNDLVAYLRSPAEGWRDDEIKNALKHGKAIQKQARNEVHESVD